MLPNAAMTFIMKKRPQEVASLYCITLWWCKQKQQDRKHNKKAGSVADWTTLLRDLVDSQNLWSLKLSKMTSDKPRNFFWSLGKCQR